MGLQTNYRSHSGVMRVAAVVVDILHRFFPQHMDRLPRETAFFEGPGPLLLSSLRQDDLSVLLSASNPQASQVTAVDKACGCNRGQYPAVRLLQIAVVVWLRCHVHLWLARCLFHPSWAGQPIVQLLNGAHSYGGQVEFGAHQVFLVRSTDSKHRLPKMLQDSNALVMTVPQSKVLVHTV